ncbi:hypothetical protein C5Y96_02475 [Blastopirellula marina]|uniref:Response regulatory domain-containing protein n=1 Tax=Blastopirellula marina TaxID=124 RepID=A0A2S8G2U6_9BACT|nr:MULTISPECIES: hypothetical protein [Pirellulaceae]PQO38766.1 hypothetical protein C5Y96_02475 [Blastopirellula marina]RCS55074.1 hypothetical protein DTL36_02480 [Bremerella cremea]
MKAVILGPSAVAETLAPVVQQRGVTVVDRIDSDLSAIRAYFEQNSTQCDLMLVVARDDLQETRSVICGLQILMSKPILVFGVARSANDVIQIIRSGAADFIEMSADFLHDLEDSLKRLFDSEVLTKRSGQVISVVSAVGGAGQTAVATNFAINLAANKRRSTVFVDLNLTGGDAAEQLGITPRQSIADCPRFADEIHTVTVSTLLEQHVSGLKLIAGPSYLGDHSLLPSESVKALIANLAQLNEFVVLDVEDAFHQEQFAALECSDVVIVVTRLDFPSLIRTKRLMEHLEGRDLSGLIVVANKYIKGTSIPEAKFESVMKRRLSVVIPHEPSSVLNGVNMGEPAVLEFPRSKFSQAITKLTNTVLSATPTREMEVHVSANA